MATLRLAPDHASGVIAFVAEGDGVLQPYDFFRARETIQPQIGVHNDWAGVLEGFTPAHVAGWSHRDLVSALDYFIELTNFDDLEHEMGCLWIVGELEPSPELLAELLRNDEPRVRELALTWMAPRVKPG